MKILCVILSLPEHLRFQTIQSVLAQSVPVDMIALLTKKSDRPSITERISDASNEGISHINLSDFDYLLRLDGDTVLGRDFIKNNLAGEPDSVGCGYAMLIKVKPFLELMGGKFHPQSDDTYLNDNFLQHGKTWTQYKELPLYAALHSGAETNYYLDKGKLMYILGWTPVHVASNVLWLYGRRWRSIFVVGGYLLSWLKRAEKLDVADFVKAYQVRSETNHFLSLFRKKL
jgi:hypothetical protein